jgi:hypothetical protein
VEHIVGINQIDIIIYEKYNVFIDPDGVAGEIQKYLLHVDVFEVDNFKSNGDLAEVS